jgi:hypothetical protein
MALVAAGAALAWLLIVRPAARREQEREALRQSGAATST